MIPEHRTTGASLVVGFIGALIGGLWVFAWITKLRGFDWAPMISAAIAAGIVTGFTACFFISQWYLKFMEYRS